MHGDVTTVNGTLGGFVILHLEYRDLEHPAYLTWKKGNTSLSNWTDHTDKFTIFSNGTLALKNTQKKDEGQYTVSVYNTTSDLVYQRIYQLHVHGKCKSIISVSHSVGLSGADPPKFVIACYGFSTHYHTLLILFSDSLGFVWSLIDLKF